MTETHVRNGRHVSPSAVISAAVGAWSKPYASCTTSRTCDFPTTMVHVPAGRTTTSEL